MHHDVLVAVYTARPIRVSHLPDEVEGTQHLWVRKQAGSLPKACIAVVFLAVFLLLHRTSPLHRLDTNLFHACQLGLDVWPIPEGFVIKVGVGGCVRRTIVHSC